MLREDITDKRDHGGMRFYCCPKDNDLQAEMVDSNSIPSPSDGKSGGHELEGQ